MACAGALRADSHDRTAAGPKPQALGETTMSKYDCPVCEKPLADHDNKQSERCADRAATEATRRKKNQ